MTLRKSLLVTAGLMMAGVTAATAAEPASTSTALNLRAGPGTDYAIIVSMPPGATVNVHECREGWCAVDWDGYQGYASATYLHGPAYAAAPPPPPVYAPPPRVYYPRAYYPRRYGPRSYGPRYYGPRYGGPSITLRFGDRPRYRGSRRYW